MKTPWLQRLTDTPLGIAVWCVDLDRAAAAPGPWPALSEVEQQRAARFAFERDRMRYLAAHRALRALLVCETGAAEGLPFVYGAQGKPGLPPAPGRAQFNLSHSGRWAAIGIHPRCEVGVDVEEKGRDQDWEALARAHFTRPEQAACLRGDKLDDDACLAVWTRKEACLKAHGSGLTSLAPSSVDVGAGPAPALVRLDTGTPAEKLIDVMSCEAGPAIVLAVARVAERTPSNTR